MKMNDFFQKTDTTRGMLEIAATIFTKYSITGKSYDTKYSSENVLKGYMIRNNGMNDRIRTLKVKVLTIPKKTFSGINSLIRNKLHKKVPRTKFCS